MKSEKLMDALGEIDPAYYMSVLPSQVRPKKRRWPAVLAAAAILCLCLASLHGLQPPAPEPEISTEDARPVDELDALERKLLALGGAFGTFEEPEMAQPGDLRAQAAYLLQQEQYEVLLQDKTLAVSLYRFGEDKLTILYTADGSQHLRLRQTGNGSVNEASDAWDEQWRETVAPSVAALVDGADWSPVQNPEPVKAAFAGYLQDHGGEQKGLTLHITCGIDQQVGMELWKDQKQQLLQLQYLGGRDVAVWIVEPMEYLDAEGLNRMIYDVLGRDMNLTYDRWQELYPMPLPEGASEGEILTGTQGLALLRSCLQKMLPLAAGPSDLPENREAYLRDRDFRAVLEQIRDYESRFPDLDTEREDFQTMTERRLVPDLDQPEALVSPTDLHDSVYRVLMDQQGTDLWQQDRDDFDARYPGFFPAASAERATVAELLQLLEAGAGQVLGWDIQVPEGETWAIYHGLVTKEDPDRLLTREQLAEILDRFLHPKYYPLLPDGSRISTVPVEEFALQEELKNKTMDVLKRRIRYSLDVAEEDLKSGTLAALPEDQAIAVYGEEIRPFLENLEQLRTQAQASREARTTKVYQLSLSFEWREVQWRQDDWAVLVGVTHGQFYEEENTLPTGLENPFHAVFRNGPDGWQLAAMEDMTVSFRKGDDWAWKQVLREALEEK